MTAGTDYIATYREHIIHLPHELNDWRFVAELGDGREAFSTMAAAREAIDQMERAKTTVVNLAAINGDGLHVNITGINRGNGHYNGLPPNASNSVNYYPDHPAIEKDILELADLRRRANVLDAKLRNSRLPIGAVRMSPEEHAKRLEALVAKHAEVLAALGPVEAEA